MDLLHTTRALQQAADEARCAGKRVALVPTMGALHAGHLSLVAEARKRADFVVVSIFVNPTQFGEAEDFDCYPRTMEADLKACREAGVDVVWNPHVEELYPEGSQTWVEVTDVTQPLCGAARPGHFRGVTTVVSKLLIAAKPHCAVFGEKDYQQLAAIRRLVRDLGFDVEIVGAPIVREPDGLALSSRNVRLGPEARQQALALVRSLDAAERSVQRGERSVSALRAAVEAEVAGASLAAVDYVELCDPVSLEPAPDPLDGPVLLALAVHFDPGPGGQGTCVRLIDNRVLAPQTPARQSGRAETQRDQETRP